jgi:predicted MFS family arabinose efflux permease
MQKHQVLNDIFVAAVFGQAYMLVTLALNIAIIVMLRSRHDQDAGAVSTPAQEQRRALERRLTIFTMATFFGHFVHSSYIVRTY